VRRSLRVLRSLRFCLCVLITVSLATFGLLSSAATKPRIVPLRTSVMFPSLSSLSAVSHLSAPIRSTDGQTVYVLTFEPDFGVGHRLEALALTLHYPHEKAGAPNLLYPSGIWHGIQPCDFVANDLAHGPQKSVFGDKRTLSLKGLGLIVRINVLRAVVSAISTCNYQLSVLALRIEVDNSNP